VGHPAAASANGDRPPGAAEPEQPRHGLLAARREARREREAREAREAREREHDRERERERVEATAQPEPGPAADSRDAAVESASPPSATATLPPGEEPVDLNAYLPGEEPINIDEYDPDPRGLDGPTHDR
jgi:hypothetical protein